VKLEDTPNTKVAPSRQDYADAARKLSRLFAQFASRIDRKVARRPESSAAGSGARRPKATEIKPTASCSRGAFRKLAILSWSAPG
jgi:hypothetical protein